MEASSTLAFALLPLEDPPFAADLLVVTFESCRASFLESGEFFKEL